MSSASSSPLLSFWLSSWDLLKKSARHKTKPSQKGKVAGVASSVALAKRAATQPLKPRTRLQTQYAQQQRANAAFQRRLLLPRDKKASLIVPESLVEILIAAILLVALFFLFSSIWNKVFGGDNTANDVQRTAALMNRMASQSDTYMVQQTPLRIGDNALLGFDSTVTSINYDAKTITKNDLPNTCGAACLCVYNANAKKITECYEIKTPNVDTSLMLETNVQGADLGNTPQIAGLPQSDQPVYPTDPTLDTTGIPLHNKGILPTQLVTTQINQEHILILNKQTANTQGAISSIWIEKIQDTRGIKFIILTNQDRVNAHKNFYQQCSTDSAQTCIGKTPEQSYGNIGTQYQNDYCALQTNGMCTIQTANSCTNDQTINTPCICNQKLLITGTCTTT